MKAAHLLQSKMKLHGNSNSRPGSTAKLLKLLLIYRKVFEENGRDYGLNYLIISVIAC